jgi:hypothetical protein
MHHQQPYTTSTSTAFVFPPETVVQTPVVINSGTKSIVLYDFWNNITRSFIKV